MKTTTRILLSLALVATMSGCEKTMDCMNTNPCLGSQIRAFKKESLCDNASVQEFRFQQKLVYVFSNGHCGADLTGKVIDDECNTLGMLGGIAGNLMINGESFANASYTRTIWKK